MTTGNIPKHLVSFSVPLILGNMFQLTYNAVDSIVVGRFSGTEALAAVGTANPVMNIIILGISGICIGASVIMSEFFGSKRFDDLKKEVATTLLFGSFFSLLIVLLGVLFSRSIMKLTGVPPELLDSSTKYLKIIFFGMPFTYYYNAIAACVRSVGDAKTPVKFLALASVLNGCLDLLFVGKFHMGVTGAGLATVIAEATAAILCIIYVYKKVPLLQLKKSELKIDKALLKRTLEQGSVTALQQACPPIGKLIVQSVMNSLGIDTIAAFNAVSRIDDFAFVPQQSIASGIMTFVAQNRGAKNGKRMREGFKIGMIVESCYWLILCIVLFFFKIPIMKLFATKDNTTIVTLGVGYLSIMAFVYILPAWTNGVQGFFRGMGDMKVTLISSFIQIVFRVIFVYILVPSHGLIGFAYASLIGWTFMLLFEVPYYFKTKKTNSLLNS